jgi:hypothetical protein
MAVFAASLAVLLAFLGLVMDGGHAYHARRNMQNAADAGALAGTQILMKNRAQTGYPAAYQAAAIDAAKRAAKANGADSNLVQVTPVDQAGNPSGWSDAKTHGLKVTAENRYDTLFIRTVGITQYNVKASGIAAWGWMSHIRGMLPMAVNYGALSSAGLNPPNYVFTSGVPYKIVLSPAGGPGSGGENYGTFKPDPPQTIEDAWEFGLRKQIALGPRYPASDVNAISLLTETKINNRIAQDPNGRWDNFREDSRRIGVIAVIDGDIGNPTFRCINFVAIFIDAVSQTNQTITLHFIDAPVRTDSTDFDVIADPPSYTPAFMKLVG